MDEQKGSLINRAQLQALVSMGCSPAMLLTTWDEVVAQVEELLRALSQSVSDRDQATGRDILHRIKGSMDTYGAIVVADACKASGWIVAEDAADQCKRLQENFWRTDGELRGILVELRERGTDSQR